MQQVIASKGSVHASTAKANTIRRCATKNMALSIMVPTTKKQIQQSSFTKSANQPPRQEDYLTDKLQIVNPTSYDINYITNQKQLDDSEEYWRRPDIIIGADHFFEFMQPYKVHHIDQFWKLEVIGIQEQPNEHDDEKALEQFKNCITKENKRYQVSWPWKDSKINLQDNYSLCYGRLRTLIKRLQTNPSLLERYDEIIKEQLQSNIIEKVTTNMDQEGIIHYLPYHEVLTPGKATTKLRIVYDASAHINGEKSLNNVSYRGPTTLPDLAGVLLRFRMMKNVIIADIEKAFLQLELHPSDRIALVFYG
uniref:DUF1758 domain-containing protein n=1 Tax=Loa loa TaxID=7209 RepID=A0A1I7VB99_LOALO